MQINILKHIWFIVSMIGWGIMFLALIHGSDIGKYLYSPNNYYALGAIIMVFGWGLYFGRDLK